MRASTNQGLSVVLDKRLSAAAIREKRKHHLYDAVARSDHALFVPLVMESYGARWTRV